MRSIVGGVNAGGGAEGGACCCLATPWVVDAAVDDWVCMVVDDVEPPVALLPAPTSPPHQVAVITVPGGNRYRSKGTLRDTSPKGSSRCGTFPPAADVPPDAAAAPPRRRAAVEIVVVVPGLAGTMVDATMTTGLYQLPAPTEAGMRNGRCTSKANLHDNCIWPKATDAPPPPPSAGPNSL